MADKEQNTIAFCTDTRNKCFYRDSDPQFCRYPEDNAKCKYLVNVKRNSTAHTALLQMKKIDKVIKEIAEVKEDLNKIKQALRIR
ncbi:hypothetical protein HDR66_00670 [bacterium]|nr:hypothetical protein [bacterium]